MKPDLNPMIERRQKLSMKLYTSTKAKISTIVACTYCEVCHSAQGFSCAIELPQAALPFECAYQIAMIMVHNERKHTYKNQQKKVAQQAIRSGRAIGFASEDLANGDILELGHDGKIQKYQIPQPFGEVAADKPTNQRSGYDRRAFGLNDRRQTGGYFAVDRRAFGRVRRSGADRRKSKYITYPSFRGAGKTSAMNYARMDWGKDPITDLPTPDKKAFDEQFLGKFESQKPAEETKKEPVFSFNGYQDWTDSVAIYNGQGTLFGLTYAALGLTGESGEFADKLKKILRVSEILAMMKTPAESITTDDHDALIAELGDALWYVARCARELGVPLDEIAAKNMLKLEARKAKDTLHGEGDNR